MKIGDTVYVHGYVDEIRRDTVIIRNNGGYFGTVKGEIIVQNTPERGEKVIDTSDAVDAIADYFDEICDTEHSFDESDLLRRLDAKATARKTGGWIKAESAQYFRKHHPAYTCSVCHYKKGGDWKYCPNCGAKMEES